MAIDWKTILSEFDGKPTLLQAIGKLRKAVEEETITIQQAQAEIAKLESQQKTDEQAIATAQKTANNALDLAKTNEKDIGTLDGQVAELETNLNNKQDKITENTALSLKKIQLDSLSYTIEIGSNSNEYDYGILFASKNVVSTGQLKPSFADEQFFKWLLPAKSGTLATTDDIKKVASIEVTLEPATAMRGTLTNEQLATLLLNDNCYIRHNGLIYTLFKRNDENTVLQYTVGYLNDTKYIQNIRVIVSSKAWQIDNIVLPQAKTYKHHIVLTSNGEKGFFDFYSSKNTNCDSLTDLKTLLGNTFEVEVCGQYSFKDSGDNDRFYRYAYITETSIFVEKVHTTQSGDLDNNYPTIGTDSNVTWSSVTITDTVTTI